MNTYKVESAGWYANVDMPNNTNTNVNLPNNTNAIFPARLKLPNNTNEPSALEAAEAATIAVSRFFSGRIRLSDFKKPLTINPIITVTSLNKRYMFYSPKIIANAGWHEEATILHKKINIHNCEPSFHYD